MNLLDQLQGQIAALSRRVGELEAATRPSRRETAEAAEARAVCEGIGLEWEVWERWDQGQKRALARELRGRGWSLARVGRVLHRSERTVKRYLA
ncbi:MAG: hypothetical protein KGL39_21380 [Patescibacteria group bacterium]|nr:hypothetical protein [Patescibacteria group bacterium]